ncbi:TonB-dependent receptor [Biformimicrobium ophioploci]|uniref:TonB-dependent receptor n=2 Tax=Biformimicrobium ophioploci TaxID=3036711 RepID=A0ABQ6M2N6_9GAMM|nr:TonB-dependent receptor [Microbulbifer sp. NKW57]
MEQFVSAAVLAAVLTPIAYAQDAEQCSVDGQEGSEVCELQTSQVTPAQQSQQEKIADEDVEEVVVTGSRLKRDSFSSIAPLQIIDTEGTREAGVIDTSTILQTSTAASGQQIDLTFSGFVLDNGPGASTVSLRGLGAGRTLVLLNGRRMAPSGVEGAPTSPDLNLIPASLVQQYELLLDGASSVYGSDAVAGVTNIILKKDFDGLEFEAFSSNPDQANGEENTLSATWGLNFDRGFIGMGLEYFDAKAVTLADREWTAGCDENLEIGLDGKVYSDERWYPEIYGMDWNGGCKVGSLAGRVSVPGAGSIYYTPGVSNGGWNGFSESSIFGFGVDSNADGTADISFSDYTLNGREQFAHLFPEQERVSFMAFGEYTFEGEMNLTPFFETLYSKRETFINSGAAQLFPNVPANNPFNICNPAGIRGVDCGQAYNDLLDSPAFAAQFAGVYGITPRQFLDFGIVNLYEDVVGAQSSLPIVSVLGDRNTTDVEVENLRFVTGMRGDLPQLNVGTLSDWSFDTSLSYSLSEGKSARYGIRGDRLSLSLNTTIEDPNNPGNFICGADNDGDGIPDGTDGCVPVDMFAPSLYNGIIGDFATAAERNYLFDSRDFDTEYEQTIFSAFASGTVYEMPAGSVIMALGLEYRRDEIKSIPDDVARDGLFFGFFSDGGASGSKDTKEAFGEIEIPLLADKFLATELTANLSARYTKDEFYGGAWTSAGKIGYRPVDSLLLRATYGTSYRAPNLRENFLQNQSGFNNLFDPCMIPDSALDPISGGYNPDLDGRSPEVLANCAASGVDPTSLSNNGFNTYSVEIARGGSEGLVEETSDSFSVGFAFDQPFFDEFDLSVGMTYFSIDIDNSIIEPSGQFLVNDCYNSAEGNSAFCSTIARDEDGFMDLVDAAFVNRDNEKARGVDWNLSYSQPVTVFGAPFDVNANLTMTRNIERSLTYVDDNGVKDRDNYLGEFGYAKWVGRSQLSIDYDKFRFTWQTRYLGKVEQAADQIDEFSDIYDSNDTGFESDTCIGVANGGTDCRDIGYADSYYTHSASLYYREDTWTAGIGVRNVFDDEPPRIDTNEILGINNTPIGYGYDLQGRSIFANVQKVF